MQKLRKLMTMTATPPKKRFRKKNKGTKAIDKRIALQVQKEMSSILLNNMTLESA